MIALAISFVPFVAGALRGLICIDVSSFHGLFPVGNGCLVMADTSQTLLGVDLPLCLRRRLPVHCHISFLLYSTRYQCWLGGPPAFYIRITSLNKLKQIIGFCQPWALILQKHIMTTYLVINVGQADTVFCALSFKLSHLSAIPITFFGKSFLKNKKVSRPSLPKPRIAILFF